MKRYRILPYKQGSKSAKSLATALGGKVLKVENSKFFKRPDDVIIHWGGPSSATNKLHFFQMIREVHPEIIPPFWTSRTQVPADAYPVVCRASLAGHSGEGIVIADTPEAMIDCPLYVKYIPKKDEYRVHLGKVSETEVTTIAIQRKARDTSNPAPNWKVRSHANGFNFVRNGVNPPSSVLERAVQAFRCSGLDFGAVDMIWNDKNKRAYVLEINTAPGLEGQTIADYATFFQGGRHG